MNVTNTKANHTESFINFDNRFRVKLLINICALLSASFAIIISLFIIVYILFLYKSRKCSNKPFNTSLLLTCNTCLAIICSSIIIILMQIASIVGDYHIISLQWIIFWACYFRGYLILVFLNAIYLSHVLQACYRLCRVVFNQYKYLRTVSTFSFYILTQWIISFIIIVPILFTGKNLSTSVIYLSKDYFCHVHAADIYNMSYAIVIVYCLPLCCMCIIYYWIITHIRHSTKDRQSISTWRLRRQNRRDAIIIKRICIVMILLLTIGFPSVIFFINYVITGYLHWAFYRLSWMMISVSYVFLCLSSIYVTPQINRSVRAKLRFSNHRTNIHIDSTSTSGVTQEHQMVMQPVCHQKPTIHMTRSV